MAEPTTDQQYLDLKQAYLQLLEERNRLRHGLRAMFGLATYYIGAHIVDLKEYRAADPDLKARIEHTEFDEVRCKHIMKVNGLAD